MKHITYLLATVAVVAPFSFASAADIESATYDWSGFYSGIHVGQTFGNGKYLYDDFPVDTLFNLDLNGLEFGTLGGYNFQTSDNLVFGFEQDSTLSRLHDVLPAIGTPVNFKVQMEGSARARIGFAHDRFLPFITAGVAFAKARSVQAGFDVDKNYHLGLVAGAGLEYALSEQFRVRSEYLYKNFGSEKYEFNGTFNDKAKWDEHVVRAAAIYAW